MAGKQIDLASAAEEALREAGFSGITSSVNRSGYLFLAGACPCGLGVSYFEADVSGLDPETVYIGVRDLGAAHIQRDREEGRWL